MLIWILDSTGQWAPSTWESNRMILAVDDAGLRPASNGSGIPVAEILSWRDSNGKTHDVFFPVSPRQFRINGIPLFAHRLLADRDEICFTEDFRRTLFYYSSETPPRVRIFSESDAPGVVFCLRCKLRVEAGQQAIACPGCGLWYHEYGQRRCWSYDAVCAGCRRQTSMDYIWKPEPVRKPRVSRRPGPGPESHS
jgi:hypothetical protein